MEILNISPRTLCFSSNKTEATETWSRSCLVVFFDANFLYILSSFCLTGGNTCPETISTSLFLKDCAPWKGTNTGAVSEELQSKGMLEHAGQDSLPWDGSHVRAGEEHQEGEAAGTKCYELTTALRVESCKMCACGKVVLDLFAFLPILV